MKISSIKIKNFRTLEDIEISFDGYFSSISGKNNAGKTTVIKAIKYLFKGDDIDFMAFGNEQELSYSNSKTQWVQNESDIMFEYNMRVDSESDPGLYSFIKKIAEIESLNESFSLKTIITLNEKNEKNIQTFIDNKEINKFETIEIYQKISSSNIVFLHNSTNSYKQIFHPTGFRSFHEMILSKDEKDELKKEQDRINRRVRKFAQDHRGELSDLLGRLEEKYEVELTVFEGLLRNSIPLGINLRDKNLEIPIDDWGAGTQNRTHIMMSILSASRIRQQAGDENRITPIIIIEEPESFLHPSAQAEFGRIIRGLARELEIQIIITTHSPYMLCQENHNSNILLDRTTFRGQLRSTKLVPVSDDKWMEPFGEILGLNDKFLEPWRDVVGASKDNAILVEGPIDKEYLEHISSLNLKGFKLPENVEIIPYGGKDALKNSIMLKFVIEKFNRIFITFDLDAKKELEKIMQQLSLNENDDYMPIGLDSDGKDCIEGLLHASILSDVYAKNTDLVMKLTSTDTNKRKSAKNELKSKLLDAFKNKKDVTIHEFSNFRPLFANINKAFK